MGDRVQRVVPPFTALPDERFGQLIRRRRRELGLGQISVAAAIGVNSKNMVSAWERGNNLPRTAELVESLAIALLLPLGMLLSVWFECRYELVECGTRRGYDLHLKNKEQPCNACRAYNASRAAVRRRSKGIPVQELAPCATQTAYLRHKRRGENCPTCIKWKEQQRLSAKEANKNKHSLALCGTTSAYHRHLRRNEPVDGACRKAANASRLKYRRLTLPA